MIGFFLCLFQTPLFASASFSTELLQALNEREIQLRNIHSSQCLVYPQYPGQFSCTPENIRQIQAELMDLDPLDWGMWAHFTAAILHKVSRAQGTNHHILHLKRKIKSRCVDNWLIARTFLLNGFKTEFTQFIRTADELAHGPRMSARPFMSTALLADTRMLLKRSAIDLAHHALDEAEKINNTSTTPNLLRIYALLSDAPLTNIQALTLQMNRLFLKGFRQNFDSILLVVSRILRITFLFFFTALSLTAMFKYYKKATHHWSEKLPRTYSLKTRNVLILLFLACIPIAGIGWISLMLLIWFFIWPYINKEERWAPIYNFLFLLGLPVLLFFESAGLERYNPHSLPGNYEFARVHGYHAERYRYLQNILNRTDKKALVYTTLSIMDVQRGHFGSATAYAKLAVQHDNRQPIALNHSANLFSVQNAHMTARALYRNAWKQGSEWPGLLNNLGKTEILLGRSQRGKRYMNQANWSARKAGLLNLDEYLKFREEQPMPWQTLIGNTWRSVISGTARFLSWRSGLWDIPLWSLPLLLLITVLCLPLRRKFWLKSPYTARCQACGVVICSHCSKDIYCEQCAKNLSNLPDQSDAHKVLAHIQSVQRLKKRWVFALANLLFPGCGEWSRGRRLFGYVLCFITALCWSVFFATQMAPVRWYLSSSERIHWAAGVPVVCVYIFFLPSFLFITYRMFRFNHSNLLWR